MPSNGEGVAARGARRGIGNGAPVSGRVRLEQIQRSRLLAAMVEVSSQHGLADATVARVVARAGVSRRTFYEIFKDREECFLAAFDDGIAQAYGYVLDAYDPEAPWVERIRAALTALLQLFDAEPATGRLLVVASLGAGARALQRRGRVLDRVVAVVEQGRDEMRSGSLLPALTAEGVVGGVLSILHTRLLARSSRADGDSHMAELVGPLMGMIVLPYLGPTAARREAGQPAPFPEPRAATARDDGDLLRGLGMRLTYRTVRVLMAVAAEPGSSNREIGTVAGISDQGQISKLLTRLQRLGLVSNVGLAPRKGVQNAWSLTPRGRRVEQAMSADSGRGSASKIGSP